MNVCYCIIGIIYITIAFALPVVAIFDCRNSCEYKYASLIIPLLMVIFPVSCYFIGNIFLKSIPEYIEINILEHNNNTNVVKSNSMV